MPTQHLSMTEQHFWVDRKHGLLYLSSRNASDTVSHAIFVRMFGKQDTDYYEVYAKLIGKPYTKKIHQLFTIRRDGCIKPSLVRLQVLIK